MNSTVKCAQCDKTQSREL